MDYEVALLLFGLILLLLGLVGRVKAKEIEVGTSSAMARIVAAAVGVLFIVFSFAPDLPRSLLSGFTDAEEEVSDTAEEHLDDPEAGQPPSAEKKPEEPVPPPPSPEQLCKDLLQNKIAWDYEGRKEWSVVNLERLCKGTTDGSQPPNCFDRVMHGGISWGDSTECQWQNAIDLCEGTGNAAPTITCFQNRIRKGNGWQEALSACQTS